MAVECYVWRGVGGGMLVSCAARVLPTVDGIHRSSRRMRDKETRKWIHR